MHLRTLRWITPIALAAVVLAWGSGQGLAQNFGPLPGVNYGAPNYANSPPLQKFVDSLPGLSAAGANTRGMYLPVAIPDTTTYQNSDYYEIGLKDYTQQLHQSLPPTKLRGYYQINTTDPTVNTPHYLGPVIVAQSGRPVRIKFTNNLATGTAGNLFLPVDTTIMGAGMGPFGMTPPVGPMEYSQNRAVLHLHGGVTPWISDGTPHQW
ncbi:MAG: laccase, partial [Planctomycetota bacterium]|nr:laccase [Planctomycetota bacterium]